MDTLLILLPVLLIVGFIALLILCDIWMTLMAVLLCAVRFLETLIALILRISRAKVPAQE
jgi:hypothetical protein